MKGELCRDLILRRQLRSASRMQGKAETMVKAKEVLFNRSALAFRSPVQVQAKHIPQEGLLSLASWQRGHRQRLKQEQVTKVRDPVWVLNKLRVVTLRELPSQ